MKNLNQGKNQESEKITIESSIPKSKDSKKVVPWEILSYPDIFNLRQSIGGGEVVNSMDSLESKSKILPSPQKLTIQTNSLNINSSITNFIDSNNGNEIPIKKRSSSFFCFRFFSKTYDLLYNIRDPRNYNLRYNVLTKDFNSISGNQFQIVYDFIRFFLISAVVVILYGFPILQLTFMSFINLIYSVHLISCQPFKRKIDFYFTVFNELCLNTGFSAVFILSCLDIQEKIELNLRINLGWVYVFSYIFLLISLICSSLIRIIFSIKLIWTQVMKRIK